MSAVYYGKRGKRRDQPERIHQSCKSKRNACWQRVTLPTDPRHRATHKKRQNVRKKPRPCVGLSVRDSCAASLVVPSGNIHSILCWGSLQCTAPLHLPPYVDGSLGGGAFVSRRRHAENRVHGRGYIYCLIIFIQQGPLGPPVAGPGSTSDSRQWLAVTHHSGRAGPRQAPRGTDKALLYTGMR